MTIRDLLSDPAISLDTTILIKLPNGHYRDATTADVHYTAGTVAICESTRLKREELWAKIGGAL